MALVNLFSTNGNKRCSCFLMVFTNVLNPRCEFPQKGSEFYHSTHVGRGASIGANATIVCGNNIGAYAFIGAGAVVTKDVPENVIVAGNPAKIIRKLNKHN